MNPASSNPSKKVDEVLKGNVCGMCANNCSKGICGTVSSRYEECLAIKNIKHYLLAILVEEIEKGEGILSKTELIEYVHSDLIEKVQELIKKKSIQKLEELLKGE